MRSLIELLELLRDYMNENPDKQEKWDGLCFIANEMEIVKIISHTEYLELESYLMKEARKSQYCKKTRYVYLFTPGDWKSRIEWLNKKIV